MAKPRSPRLPDLRAWATAPTGRFRFGRAATAASVARPFVPYGDWLAAHDTEYQWTAPHFRAMQDRLDALVAGRAPRVYFQIPIRHGKTEHNTIRFGTYLLHQIPDED